MKSEESRATERVRFLFIDACILEFGMVNRKMLTDMFGLSPGTGTRVLAAYQFERRLIMDSSSKSYYPGNDWIPISDMKETRSEDVIAALELIYQRKLTPSAGRMSRLHENKRLG